VWLVGAGERAAHAAQGKRTTKTARRQQQQKTTKQVSYVCPMHAEVTSNRPGRCPKCGMDLKAQSAADSQKTSDAGAVEKTTGETNLKLQIPDTTVYDQHGRKLNFYTDLVKGKTVAINFIFTTCQGICPTLAATFRRVQQSLGERVGQDIQLISISVDPTTDVPERLKDFSMKFKAGPGWAFVTGNKQEIDGLLSALGGYVSNKNDHTPLILIGNDEASFWTRTYGLSPATQIVNLVNDAASKSAGLSHVADGEQMMSERKMNSPSETAASYFPNHVLLTQDNKPVHFYADLIKGKVVLINFLFTTCKGVCSPMTANLAKVQKYLGERVGSEVVMISLTVDPETDTPAVLKKYAESFKAQPGWYFLTGDKKTVDWVLYKLGGYVKDKEQHNSLLIIGNEATGEWMKVHAMSNPTEIAEAVTRMLAPKKKESD
jgi:cytochrome oxidase Cu insertion factor (SCO1/SenC/PrrC family)